jgi:hypothetical protein
MRNTVLMSKKDFAEWIGVGQSSVSNYIALRQIRPWSIVGEGIHAKIDVNLAIGDLRETLDVEGSQTVNRKANLRFFWTPEAPEERALSPGELEALLVAEIEREGATQGPPGTAPARCRREYRSAPNKRGNGAR